MKKLLVISIILTQFLFTGKKTSASHLLGGEITWECLNSGKIVFSLTLYRACYAGAAGLGGSASLNNPLYQKYGGMSTISLTRTSVGGVDLNESNYCYDSSLIVKCGQTISSGLANPMDKHVYKSNPVQINGVPDSLGSKFVWSSCCRPTSHNVVGQVGFFLSATVFPYLDPITNQIRAFGSTNKGPSCYDSSPEFIESPRVAYCGIQFNQINGSSFDSDLDSVVYDWYKPDQSSNNKIVWKMGYNDSLQLPSLYHNNNNYGPILNKSTGYIDFNVHSPLASGYYHYSIKATSYKSGQKVSCIQRDVVTQIINCQQSAINASAPSIMVKEANSLNFQTSFSDTFFLGSTINLKIKIEDLDSLPTSPVSPQSVAMRMFGDAMSSIQNNDNSCIDQPCAYLDSNNTGWNVGLQTFIDTSGLEIDFIWNTDCQNLSSYNPYYQFQKNKTFRFLIEANDNFCPIPFKSTLPIYITLIDTNSSNSWTFNKIDGQLAGTELNWPVFSGNQFQSYDLFYSESQAQPWIPLISISNKNTTNYVDQGILSDLKAIRYQIKANTGKICDSSFFTFQNVHLTIGSGFLFPSISWNFPYNSSSNTNWTTRLFKSINNGPWNLISQSLSSFYNDNNLAAAKGDIIKYRVEIVDSINSLFISNIDSLLIDGNIWDGLDEKGISDIQLFPNPVHDKLIIKIDALEIGMKYRIFSIDGSEMKRGFLTSAITAIDLTAVYSGLYFIEFETEKGSMMQKKFIKH